MQVPKIIQYSEHTILITWNAIIDEKQHIQVLTAQQYLQERFANQILETVPAYHSLAIYVRPTVNIKTLIKNIKASMLAIDTTIKLPKKKVFIPVCYELTFGPDISIVAKQSNLSIEEVIDIHTTPEYLVYFLGFLPGFPYLGGLDKRLYTPRKEQPRNKVLKGTVAIGGNQTGIYPVTSPGGWQIIGHTPVPLFNIEREHNNLTLLNAGDIVKFVAVTPAQYEHIVLQIENDIYTIREEVMYD